MKALLASWKTSLLFFAALFALQAGLFFFSSSFYLGSNHQTGIPAFIKLSSLRHFGLFLALYILWGLFLGTVNAAFLRWAAPRGEARPALRFILLFSQLLVLLLVLTWQYPTLFGFLPGLEAPSLASMYAALALATLASCVLVFFFSRPRSFGAFAALTGALAFPALLHLPNTIPDRLELPLARAPQGAPSVLLLGFDALDGDHAHEALRPAVESLKLRGRFFLHAFTPLPATHPAWNSILSGNYPQHHGVRFFFSSPLEPQRPENYLPKQLGALGYHSVFASDQPETSYFGADEGFDRSAVGAVGWEAHLRGLLVNHFLLPALWLNNGLADLALRGTWNSPVLFNYDPARFFNNAFRALNRSPTAPLFLALHSCHLHSPIRLTREELDDVGGHLGLSIRDFTFWRWQKPGDPLARTPETWINPYFLRLPHTLAFLQGLTRELRDKGYFDSHLVVFLSDHGERFVPGFEIYGGIHGIDLETRAQNNVLLAVFSPRFAGFEEVADPVGLIDLAPSLLRLLGHPFEPSSYDGAPLLDPEGNFLKPAPRPLLAESMGLIEKSAWAGRFPQISVEELENNLLYDPSGPVTVGLPFYELILRRKEYVDLLQIPGMLERDPKWALKQWRK